MVEYDKARKSKLGTITEVAENEDSNKHSNINNELSKKELTQISKAAELLNSGHICPIFKVSNVTSVGINHLSKFMNLL